MGKGKILKIRKIVTELPTIVHPIKFRIGGIIFEIVSYVPLTDAQAAKAAMFYFQSYKFQKKDRGKLFRLLTQFDQDSVSFL